MKRKVTFAFDDEDVEIELEAEDIPVHGEKVRWPGTETEFIVSYVCRDFSAGLAEPPNITLTLDAWIGAPSGGAP
ncbi:hypothetical protein [Streptomyces tubercidicus]|uniref:hypothetical protein n=1 Tax=Streptomyces tubercidicus TaxID=47759 RepID=UPI0036C0733F